MEEYIDNFIESLNIKGEVRSLAEALLKSERDCNDFYIGYFGKNSYVIFDLLDYRDAKVSMSDITFDKFYDMCNNKGIKEAFENTFFQDFSESDIKMIESEIKRGDVSLESIYNSFIDNPSMSIMKIIL